MWDFQPIIDIWKAYAGTGSLLVLFLLSLFYIWKKEERKDIRNLMVWGTVLIVAGFSCPLFRKIFVRLLDSETYYRVLWVLPIGVAIAYAGMLLLREDKDSAVEEVTGDKSGEAALSGDKEKTIPFRRKRRPWVQPVGLVVLAAVVALSGSLVYKSTYISKAENAYHIPQVVVEICDEILPEEEGEGEDGKVMAVFPSELIHFVRQYSSDVMMPYGREMLVERWGNERELFDLMEAETYDVEWVADKAIQNYCRYVILNSYKPKTEPMENYEYELVRTVGAYEIYRDTRF